MAANDHRRRGRREPDENPAVTADRDDDKFLAAAVAALADAVVTNDEHLLAAAGYRGLRIVRPSEFMASSAVRDQS